MMVTYSKASFLCPSQETKLTKITEDETSQNPSSVSSRKHELTSNMHFNVTFETHDSSKRHCCCDRLVNDLLHIRNELAPLKADLRSSNEVCECNDLKFEIETKNKTIMNLASR